MPYGYIGATPTFIGNYDGFNTGVFGMAAVNSLIKEEKFAGYLGSTTAGTFYAHAFGYNFTSTASNATFNINGSYVDSPNTISAQQYTLGFSMGSGSTSSVTNDSTLYSLTLMEVLA